MQLILTKDFHFEDLFNTTRFVCQKCSKLYIKCSHLIKVEWFETKSSVDWHLIDNRFDTNILHKNMWKMTRGSNDLY